MEKRNSASQDYGITGESVESIMWIIFLKKCKREGTSSTDLAHSHVKDFFYRRKEER